MNVEELDGLALRDFAPRPTVKLASYPVPRASTPASP